MSILVTGGAGFIGSHMIHLLLEQGEQVVAVDNLTMGHRQAVLCEHFYQGDIRDDQLLERIFTEHCIEGVIHFAALTVVGDSIQKPLDYYDCNVNGTWRLLSRMVHHKTRILVFSSTAAVYGEPNAIPISEEAVLRPLSPYGETKLVAEKMLEWAFRAHDMSCISLRYFNACGAHPEGILGEDHRPETHLIPNAVRAALGMDEKMVICGNDYPTPDGTCIRDYIYIGDLVSAHLLALRKLREGKGCAAYNLGSQSGYSVLEIIKAVEEKTGKKLDFQIAERRAGDPPRLVASGEKAARELGFVSKTREIGDIIGTVLRFYERHPRGYGG